MSLSTHVLDTSRGRPAAGMAVRLDRRDEQHTWQPLVRTSTDADGRAGRWTTDHAGAYRLVFGTGAYLGPDAFYPEVTVEFLVTDPAEHHHVPLLLNPFGYATYRGS